MRKWLQLSTPALIVTIKNRTTTGSTDVVYPIIAWFTGYSCNYKGFFYRTPIKQMKTKWGTCNINARSIWLNLDLVQKSEHCLEYIIAHELVHLLERHHNAKFTAYMDQFMQQWRNYRDELNQFILNHADWSY